MTAKVNPNPIIHNQEHFALREGERERELGRLTEMKEKKKEGLMMMMMMMKLLFCVVGFVFPGLRGELE